MKHPHTALHELLRIPWAAARPRLRLLGLIATLAAILALAAGQGGWAGPAQAQTVPTITFTPAPSTNTPQPNPPPATLAPTLPALTPASTAVGTRIPGNTPGPAATAGPPAGGSGCGPGSLSLVAMRSNLRATLNLSFASLTLLGVQGQAAPEAGAVPLTGWGATAVPARALPPLPSGWRALTCSVQVWATAEGGAHLDSLRDGLLACFDIPAGTASVGSLRVAELDRRQAPARWALYAPIERHRLICSPRLRSLGTFMLLGPSS